MVLHTLMPAARLTGLAPELAKRIAVAAGYLLCTHADLSGNPPAVARGGAAKAVLLSLTPTSVVCRLQAAAQEDPWVDVARRDGARLSAGSIVLSGGSPERALAATLMLLWANLVVYQHLYR